jgi:hypothetical protein
MLLAGQPGSCSPPQVSANFIKALPLQSLSSQSTEPVRRAGQPHAPAAKPGPSQKKVCNCDADYFSASRFRHTIADNLLLVPFWAAKDRNFVPPALGPRPRADRLPHWIFLLFLSPFLEPSICPGCAGHATSKAELDSVVVVGSAVHGRPHGGVCSIGFNRFSAAASRSPAAAHCPSAAAHCRNPISSNGFTRRTPHQSPFRAARRRQRCPAQPGHGR